jgi:hypothetical protein
LHLICDSVEQDFWTFIIYYLLIDLQLQNQIQNQSYDHVLL